jgi:predicted nuclease of predicted toxin-antitoxin system
LRFLLDENLSPRLDELLSGAGHDTLHVRDLGLLRSTDRVILDRASAEGRTVISADTDFGQLLAVSGALLPSVILLRREDDRHASNQAALVLANLDQVLADLEAGAIVVLEATRVRIRRLPVRSDVDRP